MCHRRGKSECPLCRQKEGITLSKKLRGSNKRMDYLCHWTYLVTIDWDHCKIIVNKLIGQTSEVEWEKGKWTKKSE